MEVKKLHERHGEQTTIVFTLDGKLIKAKVIERMCDGVREYHVLVAHAGAVVALAPRETMSVVAASTMNTTNPVVPESSVVLSAPSPASNFTPARCMVDQTPILGDRDLVLKSPLAGLVIKVKVAVGQFVTKNQPVVVIESMKMENEICAPFPAFIKTLSISEGNLVKPNQVIVTFERRGGSGDAATKRFNDQETFEC